VKLPVSLRTAAEAADLFLVSVFTFVFETSRVTFGFLSLLVVGVKLILTEPERLG